MHVYVSGEMRENRKQQKTSTIAFTTAQYVSGKQGKCWVECRGSVERVSNECCGVMIELGLKTVVNIPVDDISRGARAMDIWLIQGKSKYRKESQVQVKAKSQKSI